LRVYPKKPLSDVWLKAAVVGSLWAAIEIVLGSLLHNLRIPFAGSTLSFITVYLVLAFFQIWKINGLIWRAGLICALMKAISPSSIILGPMIGILSQAIILDLVIRVMGKNPVSYVLGGALAVFSALAQKAFTWLVLYGWDIVVLLENMLDLAARQMGLENPKPAMLLVAFSMVYLFTGALSGFMGYRAGKRFQETGNQEKDSLELPGSGKSDLFSHSKKSDHSIPMLFIALVVLVGGMLLVGKTKLWVSASTVMLVAWSAYLRYPSGMRFVKRPALWIQFAVIIVLSFLFRNGFGKDLNFDGAEIGVRMGLRALLLLSCFSAIGSELKNPVVKGLLFRRGLRNLYQAVELAFSALPGIMNGLADQTRQPGAFRRLTVKMLAVSQAMLDGFTATDAARPPVFIIAGKEKHMGASLAREIGAGLAGLGLKVEGFFSRPGKDGLGLARHFFGENGWKAEADPGGNAVLDKPELVVVDKVGPLELNDKGWASEISELVEGGFTAQLWGVRERLLKPALRKWNIGDAYVFDPEAHSAEHIQFAILNLLKSQSNEKPSDNKKKKKG
jgi:hypothetical protein